MAFADIHPDIPLFMTFIEEYELNPVKLSYLTIVLLGVLVLFASMVLLIYLTFQICLAAIFKSPYDETAIRKFRYPFYFFYSVMGILCLFVDTRIDEIFVAIFLWFSVALITDIFIIYMFAPVKPKIKTEKKEE